MIQSNITINDGLATPVAHVFTADGSFYNAVAKRVEARWIDKSKTGLARWVMNLWQKSADKSGYKTHEFAVDIPTMEPIVGGAGTGYQAPPKVAYYGNITLRVKFSERATDAERADYAAVLKNLAAHAVAQDVFKNDERVTG